MLIAGIAGCPGKTQISGLINSIMVSRGYRVSIADSAATCKLDAKKTVNYLNELSKSGVDVLVIRIDTPRCGLNLLMQMEFNIIVFTGLSDDLVENEILEYKRFMKKALEILRKKGMVIVNVDGMGINDCLTGNGTSIVGYGFKSNSSVTTSSVGDITCEDSFMCCIQKTVKNLKGETVEPQEKKLKLSGGEYKVHNVLAAVAFDVACGMEKVGLKPVNPTLK